MSNQVPTREGTIDRLPDAVRLRVLEDHARLRWGLAELRAAAEWTETGLPDRREALLERLERFADDLVTHLEMEEQRMVPWVRGARGWGDELAERILEEHREQRIVMFDLLGELRSHRRSARSDARHALVWIDTLEADMGHEEQTLLEPGARRASVLRPIIRGDRREQRPGG